MFCYYTFWMVFKVQLCRMHLSHFLDEGFPQSQGVCCCSYTLCTHNSSALITTAAAEVISQFCFSIRADFVSESDIKLIATEGFSVISLVI